jgi:hypothetical protein
MSLDGLARAPARGDATAGTLTVPRHTGRTPEDGGQAYYPAGQSGRQPTTPALAGGEEKGG